MLLGLAKNPVIAFNYRIIKNIKAPENLIFKCLTKGTEQSLSVTTSCGPSYEEVPTL